jgi:hypothetical protein
MHVADGTALVILATVFVAFEAVWSAVALGGLGGLAAVTLRRTCERSKDISSARESLWVPSRPMGPFWTSLAMRFRVPWVKGRCRRRAYGCNAGPRRFVSSGSRSFGASWVATIATSD